MHGVVVKRRLLIDLRLVMIGAVLVYFPTLIVSNITAIKINYAIAGVFVLLSINHFLKQKKYSNYFFYCVICFFKRGILKNKWVILGLFGSVIYDCLENQSYKM